MSWAEAKELLGSKSDLLKADPPPITKNQQDAIDANLKWLDSAEGKAQIKSDLDYLKSDEWKKIKAENEKFLASKRWKKLQAANIKLANKNEAKELAAKRLTQIRPKPKFERFLKLKPNSSSKPSSITHTGRVPARKSLDYVKEEILSKRYDPSLVPVEQVFYPPPPKEKKKEKKRVVPPHLQHFAQGNWEEAIRSLSKATPSGEAKAYSQSTGIDAPTAQMMLDAEKPSKGTKTTKPMTDVLGYKKRMAAQKAKGLPTQLAPSTPTGKPGGFPAPGEVVKPSLTLSQKDQANRKKHKIPPSWKGRVVTDKDVARWRRHKFAQEYKGPSIRALRPQDDPDSKHFTGKVLGEDELYEDTPASQLQRRYDTAMAAGKKPDEKAWYGWGSGEKGWFTPKKGRGNTVTGYDFDVKQFGKETVQEAIGAAVGGGVTKLALKALGLGGTAAWNLLPKTWRSQILKQGGKVSKPLLEKIDNFFNYKALHQAQTPKKAVTEVAEKKAVTEVAEKKAVTEVAEKKAPKAIDQPRALPGSPKAIDQPRALPGSPKAIDQPRALSGSPKAIDQPRALPGSPKAIDQPRALPRSPKAIDQPRALPRSPKAIEGEMRGLPFDETVEIPPIMRDPTLVGKPGIKDAGTQTFSAAESKAARAGVGQKVVPKAADFYTQLERDALHKLVGQRDKKAIKELTKRLDAAIAKDAKSSDSIEMSKILDALPKHLKEQMGIQGTLTRELEAAGERMALREGPQLGQEAVDAWKQFFRGNHPKGDQALPRDAGVMSGAFKSSGAVTSKKFGELERQAMEIINKNPAIKKLRTGTHEQGNQWQSIWTKQLEKLLTGEVRANPSAQKALEKWIYNNAAGRQVLKSLFLWKGACDILKSIYNPDALIPPSWEGATHIVKSIKSGA